MLQYARMSLTAEQKAQVKKILNQYKRVVRGIMKKHQQNIVKIVGDLDRKKMEKIKRLISKT